MKWVALGSVSSNVDYGMTESAVEKDTGHKFLRITDIRAGEINWEGVPFCEASEDDAIKYELQTGDIVFARTGSVGNTGLVTNSPRGAVFASYLIRIRPDNKLIDPCYLSYFFQTQNYWEQIKARATGAIQGGLNATKLKELNIPLPPLGEQQRIAIHLAKADRLCRLCRYASQLGESYLQSVFLEMFGDVLLNDRKWKLEKFGDLGTLDRGRSKNRPRNAPELYGGKYPFIQTGDIANAEGYIRSYTQTYNESGLKQSKMWVAGTLCITIAANIAKTAILTFDACFPDSVVGFAPNKNANIEYIRYWLFFMQKMLEETAPESAQKNINLEILRKLDVPLPPLAEQERFAAIVARFERLRAQMREAERQGEMLLQSLLAQAFDVGQK